MRFALGAALAAVLALTASATAGTTRSDGLLRLTGKGEGTLKVVAWEGYGEPAGSSRSRSRPAAGVSTSTPAARTRWYNAHEARTRGYDLVSASGDASNRLIASGSWQPIDIKQIPDWKQVHSAR